MPVTLRILMSEHIAEVLRDLPEIRTERLILRQMRLDDAEHMFEYAGKDFFTKHLLWDTHKSIEDSRTFLQATVNAYKKGTCADFGFELKENGKFIGSGGFMTIDSYNLSAEIGYVISDKYWNMGLATEAGSALLDFAFNTLGLHRVHARCFEGNDASEKVQQKLGMKYEGMMRDSIFKNGKFCNIKMQSILKQEWEQLKSCS